MAETINMPKLGFDMAEGVLVRWVKQVGEDINKGDVLAEIETDKATVEVESSASGVVLLQIVDEGAVASLYAIYYPPNTVFFHLTLKTLYRILDLFFYTRI